MTDSYLHRREDCATSAVCDFEDLRRLSGRARPAAVKKWLQDKGILYFLNAKNQPVTTQQALNDALMRGRKTQPNWPAVREFTAKSTPQRA